MLLLAVAQSPSSDCVAIHYVLGFIDAVMFSYHGASVSESSITLFRRSLPGGGTSLASDNYSVCVHQNVALGAKSVIYDWLVLLFAHLLNTLSAVSQRCSLLLVVLLIAIGLFMFTYESTQFHTAGFILVLLASFLSGLRWTLAQMVLQREESGLSNPLDMMFHIQPWMILSLLPLSTAFEGKLITFCFFSTCKTHSALSA